MQFDTIQKRSIFKALATKSQYLVGKDFGLEKHFKNPGLITNQINKIYREVRDNPEQFTITPEVLDLVERSMEARRTNPVKTTEVIDIHVDQKKLVLGAKTKIWNLLNQKLDYLAKNKKAFRNESIMSIAKVAGIVFDKAQIASGEATEHIALKAKIDKDITPELAVEQLLRFREGTQTEDESD